MESRLYSWIRLNNRKISTFHKLLYKFNATPIRIPRVFFSEIWQADSNISLEELRLPIARVCLKEMGDLPPPGKEIRLWGIDASKE